MIAKASPDKRKPLEAEIDQQWQEIRKTNDLSRLRRLCGVCSVRCRRPETKRGLRLAEGSSRGESAFVQAELQLLQVRRQDNVQLAGRAVELLARLCTRHGEMEMRPLVPAPRPGVRPDRYSRGQNRRRPAQ